MNAGKSVLALLTLPALAASQSGPAIELTPGMIITRSVRVAPKLYTLAAPVSLDSAVITIRGNDITVDLTGSELRGMDPSTDPDRAAGIGIRVEGGRNVRVIGGRIRGYKVGLLARGTRGLVLREIDAGNNWKPRLYSLVEHESLADWLSFHQNENREWLRYGAAFYLEDVRGGELRSNRVQQGMNGLLLVRSDSLRIEANNFSFNSGLGIGLYRSSRNLIVRNRLDYNVRGYSHGFYRRGQDSAGLLLYEQSSHNVVAFNSATHGGDGLFLWAGQSTMDTGQGGANDNLFYGNDFSFAPANAMEATFSRNSFVANRAEGSDYGIWGGYSYGSKIVGNCFVRNRIGVAIEHGQDNTISGNLFAGDTTALNLWGDPIEPSEWGYPKHRDTRSRDYRIERNIFVGNRVALRARQTSGLAADANHYYAVDSVRVLRDSTRVVSRSPEQVRAITPGARQSARRCAGVPPVPGEYTRLLPAGSREVPSTDLARYDRSAIVVDEWGPFDWRSPKLWPIDSTRARPLRLRTLGPAGPWSVLSQRGIATLSRTSGRVGDTIAVTPAAESPGDWELVLQDSDGARFSYGRFEPATDWSARFWAWSDSTDLRRDSTAFATMMQRPPLLAKQLSRLDFQWYRPLLAGLPLERWALEATTTVTLPPGSYTLQTISDDGIRVWVDGKLVIDRWTQHESAIDSVGLPGGRHDLRVQFFQLDGWTELRVEIVRASKG